jgi:hypothetical protein
MSVPGVMTQLSRAGNRARPPFFTYLLTYTTHCALHQHNRGIQNFLLVEPWAVKSDQLTADSEYPSSSSSVCIILSL